MVNRQTLRAYFSKMGLVSEIADIYIALYTYGPQSISELSRNSKVERTHIYRLMNDIMASNIIEVESQYKRNIFRAAPISNLQVLISKKEQEIQDLQDELEGLHNELREDSMQSATTKIQFYQGKDGLRQMLWNQTRGSSENLSILNENMQVRTNSVFFDRWVQACNRKKLKFRGIINRNFVETQKEWYEKHTNERLKEWQSRIVSDDVFPIEYSTVIYDDVVAHFNWKDDQMFGIEIHNRQIADAQRRYFEILWQQSKPINDVELPT